MNTDNQFKFKLSNFHSNLQSGFYDLLKQEAMVDVTLVTSGKILKAHKTVLAISSVYFQEIFKNHPCKHPIVILKDVGHEVMSNMLNFMYRGEADVNQGNIASFLKLGEVLKVKDLIEEKNEGEKVSPSSAKVSKKLPEPPVCEKKPEMVVIELDESDSDEKEESQQTEGCINGDIIKNNEISPKDQDITRASEKLLVTTELEQVILRNDNNQASDPFVKLNLNKGINEEHFQDNSKPHDALQGLSRTSSHEMDFETTTEFSINQEELQHPTPLKIKSNRGRKPDLLWEYFHRHHDKTVCKECGRTYKGRAVNNSCKNHIKNKHPTMYKILMAKKRKLKGKGKAQLRRKHGNDNLNSRFSPMDSEITAGSFKNEEEATVNQTPQKVKTQERRKRSYIYDFFDKFYDGFVCKACRKIYKGAAAHTVCKKHLERKHPDLNQILLAKKKKYQELEEARSKQNS